MPLSDLTEFDAEKVFANTSDFAVSATHSGSSVNVIVLEGNELDSVRMATVHTVSTVSVSDGDLFTAGSDVWRVMHSDPAELGQQRHYCHLQLPTLLTVKDRQWLKGSAGAQSVDSQPESGQVRGKIVKRDAELEFERMRREVEPVYVIYLESDDTRDHNDVLYDEANGIAYRVVSWEKPQTFRELFRVIAEQVEI